MSRALAPCNHQALAEGRRLHADAAAERAAAEGERARAEQAVRELHEQRRGFEAERLETAKARKELVAQRTTVAKSAEATRLLQMQLAQQLSADPTPGDGDRARRDWTSLAAAHLREARVAFLPVCSV